MKVTIAPANDSNKDKDKNEVLCGELFTLQQIK